MTISWSRIRFSHRLPDSILSNAVVLEVEDRREAGLPVLDLTVSNPTTLGLAVPGARILDALHRAEALRYEPTPRGLPSAREAVARYHAGQGLAVDPDFVLLTASTSEAYSLLFKLLADPGDDVLVPQPSYPLFEHLAVLEGVQPRSFALADDGRGGWRLDPTALKAAWTPRTRAVVMVNPNNPTGTYVTPEEWAVLDDIGALNGGAVISDQVFFDFPSGEDVPRAVPRGKRVLTFVLSGLSKVVGLPQLKLGWIAILGPHDEAWEARARLEIIADTYLSVGTPVQHAAAELLGLRQEIQSPILDRVAANERWLAAHWPGGRRRRDGGWSAVLELPPGREDEAVTLALMKRRGALVHPGYFYDFEATNLIVVSLLTPEEVFRDGIAALAEEIGS